MVFKAIATIHHWAPRNTWIVIMLLMLAYFYYSAWELIFNYYEFFHASIRNLLLFGFHFVVVMVLACYHASITWSPGFVEPDWCPPDMPTDPEEQKEFRIEQQRRGFWCTQCPGFRPRRAHHCKVCGRCVLSMDHHCPWINNCVGYGNRKPFLLVAFYSVCLTMMCGMGFMLRTFDMMFNSEAYSGRLGLILYILFSDLMAAFWSLSFLQLFFNTYAMILWDSTTVESRRLEKEGRRIRAQTREQLLDNFQKIMGRAICQWWYPSLSTETDGYSFPQDDEVDSENGVVVEDDELIAAGTRNWLDQMV